MNAEQELALKLFHLYRHPKWLELTPADLTSVVEGTLDAGRRGRPQVEVEAAESLLADLKDQGARKFLKGLEARLPRSAVPSGTQPTQT